MTKTGGWASAAIVDAADLVPVPAGVSAADVETMVLNGITAWQMLHRVAKAPTGGTIVVHGANGGVGSTLVQLARHAGIRVIGTSSARNRTAVTRLGAIPLDYASGDLPAQVRALAPDGVDAVFDHVGGKGIADSFAMLAKGGALVSYGSASTRDAHGSPMLPVLKLVTRLTLWNTLPNGRRASFFNVWAGKRRQEVFRTRRREDLGHVFALLASGALTAHIAAELPLERAGEALRRAESGTALGKIVLVPAMHIPDVAR